MDELDLLREYASVFGKGTVDFTEGLREAQVRGEVRLVTLQDLY